MNVVIEIPDAQGPALIDWLSGAKKPKKTARQEISIVVSTETTARSGAWLDTNALRVPLLSITHDYVRAFEVNDVVENTKSGNWGVVTNVEGSMLTVKSSKATLAETGVPEMKFQTSEAAHLV